MAKPANQSQRSLKRALLLLAKIVVSVAILWGLGHKLDLEKVEAAWVAASLVWLIPVFLIKGVGILSSVLRWRALLRGQDLEFPLRHLIGSFLVGRFIGIVVPGTLGLDGYRAYDVARHAKAPAKAIAVIAVEKVIGLFAICLLVLATLPGGRRFLPPEALGMMAVTFFVLVVLAFALLLRPGAAEAINARLVPNWLGLRDKIGKAAAAAGVYAHRRASLAAAMGFGIMVHVCTASMYLFTARAVGADVGTADILFVAPLMIVATLVPVSFSGFGVREGVFVYFLAQVGVPIEQAALLGTLGFVGGESFSLVGGLVFLFRGRDYAPALEELKAGTRAVDLLEEEASIPPVARAVGGQS